MATVRETPEQENERQAGQGPRGQVPGVERRPRYGQPFFPVVPFGSSLYILATVIALVALALQSPAPLQNPADPINHEHINPRPEWYFLFLFQILKVFQGPFELIGTAVIPGIIALLLLGLPFYDRNWSKRAVRRPVAITSATVIIVLLAVLTYIPIESTATPTTGGAYLTSVSPHPTWANIQAIFAKNCSPCHIGGNTGGLNLDTYANLMKGGNGGGVGAPTIVVKPGNPTASYLWQVVAGKQKVGLRMPANGNILPNTDITNIYNWIQDGAKGQ